MGPGAYYAETPDGVHMLTHDGELALTGPAVYRLLDRLAPALNGQYSLADLTAHLPLERQTMVRDLVTALIERSVVRDTDRSLLWMSWWPDTSTRSASPATSAVHPRMRSGDTGTRRRW